MLTQRFDMIEILVGLAALYILKCIFRIKGQALKKETVILPLQNYADVDASETSDEIWSWAADCPEQRNEDTDDELIF